MMKGIDGNAIVSNLDERYSDRLVKKWIKGLYEYFSL